MAQRGQVYLAGAEQMAHGGADMVWDRGVPSPRQKSGPPGFRNLRSWLAARLLPRVSPRRDGCAQLERSPVPSPARLPALAAARTMDTEHEDADRAECEPSRSHRTLAAAPLTPPLPSLLAPSPAENTRLHRPARVRQRASSPLSRGLTHDTLTAAFGARTVKYRPLGFPREFPVDVPA